MHVERSLGHAQQLLHLRIVEEGEHQLLDDPVERRDAPHGDVHDANAEVWALKAPLPQGSSKPEHRVGFAACCSHFVKNLLFVSNPSRHELTLRR